SGSESRNAVSDGLNIINQVDSLGFQERDEGEGIDRPSRVGNDAALGFDRTGNRKAGALNLQVIVHEGGDDFVEALMFRALVDELRVDTERAILVLIQR